MALIKYRVLHARVLNNQVLNVRFQASGCKCRLASRLSGPNWVGWGYVSAPLTDTLTDSYGRVIRDLRISVTPRCNFRCSYCDPLGMGYKDPLGTVSVADVSRVIDAAVSLGLTSVRFTGGEPLLRKELPEMIAYARDAGSRRRRHHHQRHPLKTPFTRTVRRRVTTCQHLTRRGRRRGV